MVTAGGIVGRVAKAPTKEDAEVTVEIADNVQVKVVKATLSRGARQEPAGRRQSRQELIGDAAGFDLDQDCSSRSSCSPAFSIALPNALPDNVRAQIPGWLPSQTVTLGLDLQGGSYLLLEVELDAVQKDKLESLMGDIRRALRKAHIGYDRSRRQRPTRSRSQITDPTQRDEAQDADRGPQSQHGLRRARRERQGLRILGQRAGHASSMKITDAYKTQTQAEIVNQSIEVVRRRIDADGHARADNRAAGRRPHPGAGAGPEGSRAPEGHCSARPPR